MVNVYVVYYEPTGQNLAVYLDAENASVECDRLNQEDDREDGPNYFIEILPLKP